MNRNFVIFVLLIGIFFIINNYINVNSNQKSFEEIQTEINNLNLQIKINESRIESSNAKIKALQDSIFYLNLEIDSNNLKIKNLNKIYNEKISNISKFNSNDIQQYISNRYGNK